MTITQLRNEFKARIRFDELTKSGLSDYLKQEWETLETLYSEGAVSRRTDYISDDMLALAAGYDPQKENSGFTVVRCLDLAYIYATKKHVRNMMMLFLGISEPQKSAHAEQEQQETVKETESAPEQTAEQEQQEETATTESDNQAEADTYEHALKMAMYAAEYGDGVQAIFHKDGKFKAGLESDREYAEKNGWQYFHTVWETVQEEERMKQQKHDQIKEARKKSLFWSRRLSYKSADSHPEWREKYKSAKQELERAKAESKEETIMSMNTTTANDFEIEFKANNPEEQKYLDMIQKVERMGTIRYRFTIADNFCMDVVICEHDLNDKNDLMNLWYKHGYVKERTLTHMGLGCYYTDFENGCYGRYNPTETKSKLNFEWVLPYTPENLGKLLAEAIKRYDDDSDMFVIDVNGSLTYANSVISKGESPEEAVEEAFAKAHEDAERYAEYKKLYPENAEYWQKQIDECKNADYRAMRYSDFARIQRQKLLKQPMCEVTAEDYEEMLDVLPPIHYVEINGVSEFCMMEMFTGTFTNQYAHDKKTGKYYQKLVDVTDRDTWIHKILERK